MAIAEQLRIDPGTEMIPTPLLYLPRFDVDQFVMHHDILIGYWIRLNCWYLTPLLDLSRTAPPSRRAGATLIDSIVALGPVSPSDGTAVNDSRQLSPLNFCQTRLPDASGP